MRRSLAGRAALGIAATLLVVVGSCKQSHDPDALPRLEEHATWGGSPPPEPVDGVRVGRVDRGIHIMNGTSQPIFYAVWALHYLGQFTPCTEAGEGCLQLDRGDRVVVPLEAMVGYAPDEREAVVRWWRVESDAPSGRRPRDLHVIGVPLSD